MLSDSPPERDVQWTQEGVDGAWRLVQRVAADRYPGRKLADIKTAQPDEMLARMIYIARCIAAFTR